MKYVLEPLLFAFDEGLSEQELIDYLDELVVLDGWWNQFREDMFIQDSTRDVLFRNNYFPTGDTLKPLIEKYRINYIQYSDVERIIAKMLNKTNIIESLYDEPLMEKKNQTFKKPITVEPGVKRPDVLHKELLSLLWHIFLVREMGECEEKSFVIITKGVSDIVSVEYEYEEIDVNLNIKEKTATSEVNCKSSLEAFLKDDATPFLLWKTAERKKDLELGIRVSVMQLKDESDIERIKSDYRFVIQDSFYEDYCSGHYRSKDQDIRSAIQALTDAVTEQNMRKVHAIRTGKKGNDPQLVINEYGAQRRDITTSLKLAYWKKGREFKIANMREHDFFEPTWES